MSNEIAPTIHAPSISEKGGLSLDDRISIHEFKALLGSMADGMSEVEIERLRDLEDHLAEIIFDAWLRERNAPPQLAEFAET
jgi:hypothetical protein